ncbi:MAG: methyltransferase [Proteobacteria bacterium]|nr:methyltransferase [Pseudomonadota bacterium]
MAVVPAEFVRRETTIATAPLVPELKLHLADTALALWQATEDTLGRIGLPPPFWAFAWPGGQALARYLLDHPDSVRGRRVLDVGAGCGIGALAAARAGAAPAIAADIDAFAVAAIALKPALNHHAGSITAADVLAAPPAADVVLLGDMCYERPLAERALAWARAAARAGVMVLLADPGRAYRPTDGLAELARYTVPTTLDLEDRTERDTVVWRLVSR